MILSSLFSFLPVDWHIFLYLRGMKNGSSVINLTKKWITSSSLTEPPVGLLCKLSINCPSASELYKTNKLSWQLPFNSIQNRVNWIQTEYIDSISLIHYADSTTHLLLMMFQLFGLLNWIRVVYKIKKLPLTSGKEEG